MAVHEVPAPPGAMPGHYLIDADEMVFRRWMLQTALDGLDDAKPGSIAQQSAMREVRMARAELQAHRDLAAQSGAVDRSAMTPEEWQAAILEDAQAATDQDLEVYAHEWLSRVGLRLLVEDGEPRLVRAAG